jgi:hypothetical protein
VSLATYFAADFAAVLAELPITVTFQNSTFSANRTTFRVENSVGDGGFMTQIAMVITAPYNATTQQINLGDVVTIDAANFRVVSAELAQDAVSVDFALQDVNR